jgi:3-phenylpropionate/trans-cinnamate dioxygenase ferredoxin subunit
MTDLAFDQMVEGKPVKIEKEGKSICVTRVGNEVFAIADTCSHSDASRSEGEVTRTQN